LLLLAELMPLGVKRYFSPKLFVVVILKNSRL
jgi:hypothetical protein